MKQIIENQIQIKRGVFFIHLPVFSIFSGNQKFTLPDELYQAYNLQDCDSASSNNLHDHLSSRFALSAQNGKINCQTNIHGVIIICLEILEFLFLHTNIPDAMLEFLFLQTKPNLLND